VLTLQKCRSLLGTDCKLIDTQLEQLRAELYALSDVVIEVYSAQKRANPADSSKLKNTETCLTAVPQEERQAVEERAAILEFEGGLKKSEAERQAFGEWVQSNKPADYSPKRRRKKPSRARKPRLTQ
jgi:hypothetical protein